MLPEPEVPLEHLVIQAPQVMLACLEVLELPVFRGRLVRTVSRAPRDSLVMTGRPELPALEVYQGPEDRLVLLVRPDHWVYREIPVPPVHTVCRAQPAREALTVHQEQPEQLERPAMLGAQALSACLVTLVYRVLTAPWEIEDLRVVLVPRDSRDNWVILDLQGHRATPGLKDLPDLLVFQEVLELLDCRGETAKLESPEIRAKQDLRGLVVVQEIRDLLVLKVHPVIQDIKVSQVLPDLKGWTDLLVQKGLKEIREILDLADRTDHRDNLGSQVQAAILEPTVILDPKELLEVPEPQVQKGILVHREHRVLRGPLELVLFWQKGV